MTSTARPRRRRATLAIFLFTCVFAMGCQGFGGFVNTPTKAGIDPDLIADPSLFEERARNPAYYVMKEPICRTKIEPLPGQKPYNFLALSGGFGDAAYAAGVLCGMSENNTRPAEFDVVTGTSAGALVATLAFLGPQYDELLKQQFTTIITDGVRKRRALFDIIFSTSGSDNAPLRRRLETIFTKELMAEVAQEHAKGRRLYVVTFNLDGRRPCNWDLTSIASKGTDEAHELFINVLLATCMAPPTFPPVKIKIRVDGCCYEETHCDGGAVANASAQAPFLPPSTKSDKEFEAEMLTKLKGSNLYIIRCGKLYIPPQPVPQNIVAIGTANLEAALSNATSDELIKIYFLSRFLGVNYQQTAIPEDAPGIKDQRFFKPEEMGPLFELGRCRILEGTAWRPLPPGLAPGEANLMRGGPDLYTVTPEQAVLQLPPCFRNLPPKKNYTKPYSPGTQNFLPKR